MIKLEEETLRAWAMNQNLPTITRLHYLAMAKAVDGVAEFSSMEIQDFLDIERQSVYRLLSKMTEAGIIYPSSTPRRILLVGLSEAPEDETLSDLPPIDSEPVEETSEYLADHPAIRIVEGWLSGDRPDDWFLEILEELGSKQNQLFLDVKEGKDTEVTRELIELFDERMS